jgi:TolA protein
MPPLAVPVVPPAPRRRRPLLVLATVASLALHASSLLALLNWRGPGDLGVVAVVTEAISVEIVESKVLEATPTSQSSEPAPSVEATAPQEGSVDAVAAPSEKPAEQPKEATEAPKAQPLPEPDAPDERTRVVVQEAPRQPEAETLPVEGPGEKKELASAEEAARAKQKEQEEEARRKEQEQEAKRKEQEREAKRKVEQEEARRKEREREKEAQAKANSRAGGPTSRASDGKGAGAARASASTGSIMAYAAKVRAQVARNRPSGRRAHGIVVISFGLTVSGELTSASIARSSGNRALDEAALASVRSAAPFPKPPAGATTAQLVFSIPFQFR